MLTRSKSHIEVKGHLRLSFKAENVKVISFENLKSDWNQTWLIDIMQEATHVHEVEGHKYKVKCYVRSTYKIA